MNEEIFKGIVNGLMEAKDFMEGKDTGAIINFQYDIKALRKKLKLSQDCFANEYGIKLKNLKNWESGRKNMDNSTVIFFKLIELYPDLVKKVINDYDLYV